MNFKPKIVTCAAMALLLDSACTPTILDGNSKGGIDESQSRLNIEFVGVEFKSFAKRSQEITLDKSDRHCAQFDKRARIIVKGDNAFQFGCFGGPEKGT
jgi:hypothetical protein